MTQTQELMNNWTTLKEKVNTLKLSEKDKEIVNYLANCKLNDFSSYLDEKYLTNWEIKIEEIINKINQFDSDNDLVVNYWFLASQYASIILDWIEKRRMVNSLRRELKSMTSPNLGFEPEIEEID